MHGQHVCRMHGGSTRAARAKADQRIREAEAEAQLARLNLTASPDTDPSESLLRSVAATASMCRYWRARVEALTDDDMIATEHGHHGAARKVAAVPLDQLHTWEHLHAKICLGALRAGIDERRIQLAERQAEIIVAVLRASLAELGHDVDNEQVGTVVAGHLATYQTLSMN